MKGSNKANGKDRITRRFVSSVSVHLNAQVSRKLKRHQTALLEQETDIGIQYHD